MEIAFIIFNGEEIMGSSVGNSTYFVIFCYFLLFFVILLFCYFVILLFCYFVILFKKKTWKANSKVGSKINAFNFSSGFSANSLFSNFSESTFKWSLFSTAFLSESDLSDSPFCWRVGSEISFARSGLEEMEISFFVGDFRRFCTIGIK